MYFFKHLIVVGIALSADPDSSASLEVLLVPPAKPYPQVAAEISRVSQASLHEQEAKKMIDEAFAQEISFAAKNAGRFDYAAASFNEVAGDPYVEVHLLPAHGPSSLVRSNIDDMAARRTSQLLAFVNLVKSEMRQITASYLSKTKKSSFLQTESPLLANVRVGTAGVYPRVASLVLNMEQRFDEVENKIRIYALSVLKKLNEAEANLFKSQFENNVEFIEKGPSNALLRGKGASTTSLILNVHPPEEDTVEIQQSLAALSRMEERNNAALDKTFLNTLGQTV